MNGINILPNHLQNKVRKIFPWCLLFCLNFLFIFPAYSQNVPNVQSLSADAILQNIAHQIPALMRFITALAYVMGMYFIVMGVMKLKQYGEARTQMSQEHSLKGPIIYLTIGTLLLYLPTSVSVGLSTFWTEPSPYAYLDEPTGGWFDLYNVCFLVIQFIGTIAFIRGLLILSRLSGHAQPGEFGRGLTHIIGGIFCINIYQFVQVIFVTLGIHT